MIISVAGEHRLSRAPERATVHLQLSFESKAPDKAMAALQRAVAQLSAEIETLRILDPFPITASSIQPPGTRSWQPWDDEGRQLPMRHAATARASVQFCDFDELAVQARAWGERAGWAIDDVVWELTSDTRASLHDQAVSAAIENAKHRAEVMCRAAGGTEVDLLEVADAGLLGGNPSDAGAVAGQARFAASMGRPEGLVIEPADIEVEALVHARFQG